MTTPTPSPLLLDATAAAALCGLSRSTFLRCDATGRLGPSRIRLAGRLVRWRRADLEQWVRAGCPCRVQFLREVDGSPDGSQARAGKSASRGRKGRLASDSDSAEQG